MEREDIKNGQIVYSYNYGFGTIQNVCNALKNGEHTDDPNAMVYDIVQFSNDDVIDGILDHSSANEKTRIATIEEVELSFRKTLNQIEKDIIVLNEFKIDTEKRLVQLNNLR